MGLPADLLAVAKRFDIWTPGEAMRVFERAQNGTEVSVNDQAAILRLAGMQFNIVPSTRRVYTPRTTKVPQKDGPLNAASTQAMNHHLKGVLEGRPKP